MMLSLLHLLLFLNIANIHCKKSVRARTTQNEECILHKMEVEMASTAQSHLSSWLCELSDEDAARAGYRYVDVEGVDSDVLNMVRSGDSTLFANNAKISSGVMYIPYGANIVIGKAKRRGPAAQTGSKRENQRNLVSTENERLVLAVRVKAVDSETTSSISLLSDKIFGLNGDTNNAKERFDTCSYGELTMKPFEGTTTTGVTVTNGVVEVDINTSVQGKSNRDIESLVEAALASMLGDLPSQFDHVMLCLPPGTNGGWIAYAYIGGWLSIYNDQWCNKPSASMHELGHNLRLQHAWEEGEGEYNDRSGMMGISYSEDSTFMCFNPAMSWQLGWYGRKRKLIDFTESGGFNGKLIGVESYNDPAAVDMYVAIKVESPTFEEDVFVGFNLRRGINKSTRDAINRVTVHSQVDEGVSHLKAELSSGEEFRIARFQDNSGLNIKVRSINLSASPPFAEVDIYVDGCAPGVCSTMCNCCISDSDCDKGDACVVGSCSSTGYCSYDTSTCPGHFEVQLLTDSWGSEITWELQNQCNGDTVLTGDGYDAFSEYTSSQVIGKGLFKLVVQDEYGDGIINPGFLRATLDGIEVGNASGNFRMNEIFFFGTECEDKGNISLPKAPIKRPNSGDQSFALMFKTDDYPQDTSWIVRDMCNFNSVVLSGDSYDQPNSLITESTTLKESKYELIFRDSFGDGLSIGLAGPYFYSVDVDGEREIYVTDFGRGSTTRSTTFGSECSNQEFVLRIKTDTYPMDTSWEVKDICNNDAVVFSGGSYTKADTLMIEKAFLPPSKYALHFKDSHGDGLSNGLKGPYFYSAELDGKVVISDYNFRQGSFLKITEFGRSKCF